MDFSITPMLPHHWPAVREIYQEGIQTGNATFATEVSTWEQWDASHRADCRLVAKAANPATDEEEKKSMRLTNSEALPVSANILGWSALSPVSVRSVYAGVAEVSVYVAASARGRGAGKELLRALIRESEISGIWTLQAGIFPENSASLSLHKSCGFREVGVRQRLAKMGSEWRDVLLLERRSSRVGI